jgi:uncharacterized membrane-anchored protein YhcB (DUF1043 family)
MRFCAALAGCCILVSGAASGAEVLTATDNGTGARAASRTRAVGTIDTRVRVLARALQLDPQQQAQLRAVLDNQRQAVVKIWADPALLAAERAPATRAVEQRTADEIRALLTDEQKRRYNSAASLDSKSAPPDVEAWMRRQSAARE